jgi:hypothetical protein
MTRIVPAAERGDFEEELELAPEAPHVDLSLQVFKRGKAEKSFSVKVQSPLLDEYRTGQIDDWEIESDSASEMVTDYMNQFAAEGQSQAARTASLTGAGIELFHSAPEVFKKAYWELIDSKAPLRTILVASEERSIPWELFVPTRDGISAFGGPLPLGARHIVARWFETPLKAPVPTPLVDARVVAPEHDGMQPLAKAADESKLVCQSFHGALVTPALVGDIDTTLGAWDGTLLHFVCHGESPLGGAQILLLDGSEKLYSTAVKALVGLTTTLQRRRALVFLNACKVGGAAPALVGSGGFAYEFIVRGARAVIAPLWAVDDTIAYQVASAFYQQVISAPKTPFAEILTGLRAKAYAKGGGEDTWAAYCFYGDPLLAASE